MSPLTKEQIKKLLEKKPRTRKKAGIDDSVRDYKTWFKLHHHMFEKDTMEDIHCENPNCIDPRDHVITALGNNVRSQLCANVKGKYMCRYCFLDGWLSDNPDQTRLTD